MVINGKEVKVLTETDKALVAEAKAKAKSLVVIDGVELRKGNGYRLKIYGGIVDGVQVVDFDGKDEAMQWLMADAFPFYTKMGKTVRPKIK